MAGKNMIKLAFVSFFAAVIAGLLGFNGLAGSPAIIAKLLFALFLMVCLALFVATVWLRKGAF